MKPLISAHPFKVCNARVNSKGGFTLIELVVVMALAGIIVFFSMPRFGTYIAMDSKKTVSRWIIIKAGSLKERAIRDNRQYVLHVDMASGKLWVSHKKMSDEGLEEAERKGMELPDDIRVVDVEFPTGGKLSSGVARINFYEKGYSDKALIHMESDDGSRMTFQIEPFLKKVMLHEKYIEFDG